MRPRIREGKKEVKPSTPPDKTGKVKVPPPPPITPKRELKWQQEIDSYNILSTPLEEANNINYGDQNQANINFGLQKDFTYNQGSFSGAHIEYSAFYINNNHKLDEEDKLDLFGRLMKVEEQIKVLSQTQPETSKELASKLDNYTQKVTVRKEDGRSKTEMLSALNELNNAIDAVDQPRPSLLGSIFGYVSGLATALLGRC
jgi:hypothetical protein